MTGQASVIDAQLQRAMALHRARHWAEAESVYQSLLAMRPDWAEVLVSCALAQISQTKYCDAENSLRAAIRCQPGMAKAQLQLGNCLCLQGRHGEAVACYEGALKLEPDCVQAHNNLGNALYLLGERQRAAAAYRRAIGFRPDFAQAHNNLGLIHLQQNQFEEACTAFARAVALAPSFAEAHNNLGHALHKLARPQKAEEAFGAALRLAPNYGDAHINLSALFFEQGRLEQAEASARNAVRYAPAIAESHNALGNALRAEGKLEQAQSCYRHAIGLCPDYGDGTKNLAMVLEEMGRLDDAFALFAQHGRRAYDRTGGASPAHKQRHDQEQQLWRHDEAAGFHLGDGARILEPAVNPCDGRINAQWSASRPQIVVIDDLLSQQALDKLRRFCLESTIWNKAYDGGYLGAFPEDGFAPPLLAQIAEELRATYPAIIEDHPLLHFWAFKYDSGLMGIKKHADFAAVNVNFWITPDAANLDPESGGLVIWDVAAPLDWDFAKYNAAEDEIRAFLQSRKAKPVTIAYRANRAVIFDSDLFHETDRINFKTGYENRRINVTLLFGRRQTRESMQGR